MRSLVCICQRPVIGNLRVTEVTSPRHRGFRLLSGRALHKDQAHQGHSRNPAATGRVEGHAGGQRGPGSRQGAGRSLQDETDFKNVLEHIERCLSYLGEFASCDG